MGVKVFTSERVTLGTHNSVDIDSIKFNGENFVATAVTATTASTTNAAAVIAAQINENTGVHGAIASAFNRIEGGPMGPDFSMTATIYYCYWRCYWNYSCSINYGWSCRSN